MLYYTNMVMADGGGNGNGNGFTGLNPQLAKKNIENFAYACADALSRYHEAHKYLFDELYNVWASPNATEFSQKIAKQHREVMFQCKNTILVNIKNALRAYSILAHSNGIPLFGIDYGDVVSKIRNVDEDLKTLEAKSKRGLTGMNVQLVGIILDEYKKKIYSIDVNSIPREIAFYDKSNEMGKTYKVVMDKMITKMVELNDSMLHEILRFTDTEKDNIILASKQAADEINSVQI